MKHKQVEKSEEREDIIKLVGEDDAEKFFNNLDNFDDYIMGRVASSLAKGEDVVEIAQTRKDGATNIAYLAADEIEPVVNERFQKAMKSEDFDRAAKWKKLRDTYYE